MEIKDAFFSKSLEKNLQKPGFEAWSSVIIDAKEKKSVWLKYSTFIPLKTDNYTPAAIIWGSFFDYNNPENNISFANSSFLASLSNLDTIYNFPNGTINIDKFNGFFNTDDNNLEWEFNFEHRNKPLKYRANAFSVSPFGFANGYFKLDNKEFKFKNAQSTIMHLSGANLIEDTVWLYAPKFDSDLEGWQLEIFSFRQGLFFTRYTFVTLFDGQDFFVSNLVEAMANTVNINYPSIEFDIRIKDYKLKVKANLSDNVSRFICKNTDEINRYIVRSDISSLKININSFACKRDLRVDNSCTIEIMSSNFYDEEAYLDPLDNEQEV